MKYFSEILAKFTPTQRLLVLIIMFVFTVGGFLAAQWMRTDDCRSLMSENVKMHQDFALISEMLREEIMRRNQSLVAVDSAAAFEPEITGGNPASTFKQEETDVKIVEKPTPVDIGLLESLDKIVQSNLKSN